MKKFRRLFNRADLTGEEVAMLRGILSQVEWAINCNNFVAIDDTLKATPDRVETNPLSLDGWLRGEVRAVHEVGWEMISINVFKQS